MLGHRMKREFGVLQDEVQLKVKSRYDLVQTVLKLEQTTEPKSIKSFLSRGGNQVKVFTGTLITKSKSSGGKTFSNKTENEGEKSAYDVADVL